MQRYGIGDQELKLAKLLWANEGIGSGTVVTLCKDEFGWAKSTTYTMLRRICEHGLFQNKNSIVTAKLSEEQYLARTAKEFLSDKFEGSLTSFVSIYAKHNHLSTKDIKTLTELVSKK